MTTRAQIVVLARMSFGWRLVCELRRKTGAVRYYVERAGRREKGEELYLDVPVATARALIADGLVVVVDCGAFLTRYKPSRAGLDLVAAARQAGRLEPSEDPPAEGLRSTKASRAATRALDRP